MTNSFTKLSIIACVAALAFACGQSDPPEANGPHAEPDAPDYYPLVDGATYTYAHTGAGGWTDTITVKAIEHNGQPAFLVSDAGHPSRERGESIMVKDGSAVFRVQKKTFNASGAQIEHVEYSPGFIRGDAAWAKQAAGTRLTIGYQRTEFAFDGTPTVNSREHEYTIEAIGETTSISSGDFKNVVKVRRKRTWMTDIPDGEGQEKVFWLAPGVGKILESSDTGSSEELIKFSLPE